MWSGIAQKLKVIEENLIENGKYVNNFDSMSLASLELSDLDEIIVPSVSTIRLNGLVELERDISAVLNEAYIVQQNSLIKLNSEIAQCHSYNDRVLDQGHLYDTSKNNDDFRAVNASSSRSSSHQLIDTESYDDKLGRLKKESFPHLNKGKKQMKHNMLERQLRRSVKEIHGNLITILDTKLEAYEIVSVCMEYYLKMIVKIASDNKISHSLPRAKSLVQPQLNFLLSNRFLDTKEINESLLSLRQFWAEAYYHKDLLLAERSLQLKELSVDPSSSHGMMRLKMGAVLTLLLWSFSECFNNEQEGKEIWRDPTFAIFMCFGDFLLLLLMWGLSMRVWRISGIDFVRLLGLEGTEIEGLKTPEHGVYSSVTDLSLLFLFIFISFNKAIRGVFNVHTSMAFAHAIPTLMVVYFIYRIAFPYTHRKKWLNMLYLVLSAPFNPVTFRDGYIGDILTSLVKVLIPMCFSFAYLIMSAYAWLSNDIKKVSSISGLWWEGNSFYTFGLVPIITLFPLWIRLMQCLRRSVESGQRWPHMGNACKYTSAIAVIAYGTFRPSLRDDFLWIMSFVFATLFQFIWDLTMDWGILTRNPTSESHFLGISMRKNRLLGPTWVYVTVILSNFFLRFAWALTLLPDEGIDGPKTVYGIILFHLGPLIAASEVIRRMVWGLLRLEHEQLEVLGYPEGSSEYSLSAASEIKSFDKMEIGDSIDSEDDSEREKKMLLHISINDVGTEWILNLPFFSSISNLLIRYSTIESSTSEKVKARYVEAIFFGFFVLCIILSAARIHIGI